MPEKNFKYIGREISWLSFNERVLQEAADKRVQLIERLKFLGIFSSNMDEFFRVRVATVRRMMEFKKTAKEVLGDSPVKIMKHIHGLVLKHQKQFDQIYSEIIEELGAHKIFIINEKQ